MRIVHHLEKSRSLRLIWLLEELGLPYEIKGHLRDPETMRAGPELLALHPTGTAPLLEEDGKIYAETGAIFEHLLENTDSPLMPQSGPEREAVRYWLHHAEGSAMPPLVMTLIFDTMVARSPRLIRPLTRKISKTTSDAYHGPMVDRMTAFWESELAKTGWFVSDFSAADIIMSFPVEAAESRLDLQNKPAIADWLKRIHAREAYQRAVAAARAALGGDTV